MVLPVALCCLAAIAVAATVVQPAWPGRLVAGLLWFGGAWRSMALAAGVALAAVTLATNTAAPGATWQAIRGAIGSRHLWIVAGFIFFYNFSPSFGPALVYYAKASDVTMSIVDGQMVLEDGRPVRLDQDRILREVASRTAGWRSRLAALGSRAVFGPGCPCCG